ncbi:MAG TPA: hypothetical protein VNA30_04480 [Mycobacteriales bacterium]|nr:hypothetical protein [Mycobacteriales bacterium]
MTRYDADKLREGLADLVVDPPPPPPDRRTAIATRAARLRRRRRGALLAAGAGTAVVAVLAGSLTAPALGGGDGLRTVAAALSEFGGPQTNESESPRPSPRPSKTRATPPPDQPLQVQAAVRPREAKPGQEVNVLVKLSDGDGRLLSASIDFGDGTAPYTKENEQVRCPAPKDGAERSAAPTVQNLKVKHTYATSATYTVTAVVRTGGCGAATERAEARTSTRIHPDAPSPSPRPSSSRSPQPATSASPAPSATEAAGPPSNGPEAPRASVEQVPPPEDGNSSRTYIRVRGADKDGFVQQITVDWGDGSAPEQRFFRTDRCRVGESGYPSSRRAVNLSHAYASGSERHTVTVRVRSTGCDGGSPQEAVASRTMDASGSPQPRPQPSPTSGP